VSVLFFYFKALLFTISLTNRLRDINICTLLAFSQVKVVTRSEKASFHDSTGKVEGEREHTEKLAILEIPKYKIKS
jgi:hypothetical protein